MLAARFIIEPAEPAAPVRYRFHDLTREYARRRAAAFKERDAVPERVYLALLTLVRRAHAGLYGADFDVVHSAVPGWDAPPEVLAEVDASPLDWFETERANIRAAVAHCAALGLAQICWDLAVSSHEFYTIRGYFDDWSATHAAALQACRAAGDRHGEGMVLTCLNQPALVASRRAAGAPVTELERAADLLAASGDRHGEAIALRTLANALRRQGHLSRPLALFERALAGYAEAGDTAGRGQALRFIGQTHLDRGDHRAARRALDAAETVVGEIGDSRLTAQTRYWTGQACLATGDLDGAQAAFGAVLAALGEGPGVGRAYAEHGMGQAACSRGEYGPALRYLTEAADLARDGADAVLEGRVWLSIAALHQAQRNPHGQITALETAEAVFAGCGAAYLEIRALHGLASVMVERDDTDAVQRAWTRIESLYDAAGVPGEDRVHRRPGR